MYKLFAFAYRKKWLKRNVIYRKIIKSTIIVTTSFFHEAKTEQLLVFPRYAIYSLSLILANVVTRNVDAEIFIT